MKGIKVVTIVVVLLLAAAITWLFVSGRLAWVDSNGHLSTTKIICNADIVTTYNDAAFYQVRSGSTDPTLDKDALTKLLTEIKGKEGYKNDATCQTILLQSAIDDQDYDGAKVAYEAVNDLHSKGIFVDSNLRNNAPLFTYESAIAELSPEAKNNKEGFGENE